MQNDKLHIWRLSNDVSVVNAAILIVGGDPSTKDQIENYSYNDYSPFFEKRTEGHEGFEAAFSALRAAIQNGQLNAKLHYPAKKETYHAGDDTYDYCLVSSKSIAAKFSDDSVSEHMELLASGSVSVGRKPNWSESLIAVSDLKAWLFSRGFTSGFFFPTEQPENDSFLNQEHDHFSAELALAVLVWKSLASNQMTGHSPKSAIENWINDHPEAWHGQGSISINAKERVVTLVNWRKTGGAPTTNG